MEFELIEMTPSPPYTQIGRTAGLFLFIAFIILIYFSIKLLIRYSRLWRYSQLLEQPLLTYFETGKWQGTYLASWRGIKRTEFLTIVEALRRGITGLSPIPMTSTINQALDHLAAPFIRMATHLKVVGWSACLLGFLGTIGEMRWTFRGVALTQTKALYVLADGIEKDTHLVLYGLAIGLACLWGSSLARSRLSLLHQDLSNRLLAASVKKAE